MFIKYDYTADGKPIMVEVTEEVAEFLREDERVTGNADRRERDHCQFHMDAMDYEGEAFAYRETPEQILLRKERDMALWKAMEVLSNTQFAVFTGNAVEDRPCTDCTEAILLTLNQGMRREEKKPVSQKPLDKFSALYDRGDISGYHSHSEADAALCTMLANRVGDNAAEIDRLFRASALYRDKWERRDYREATIRMALESYRERKIALPNFIREGKNRGKELYFESFREAMLFCRGLIKEEKTHGN